jgi:DNA polymerase eta
VDAWFWERPPHAWGMDERRLACGACVMADMRTAVAKELGYTCSAGIAPNKVRGERGRRPWPGMRWRASRA